MSITDPCKEREPKVISNELIKQCIDYQFPKGEVGRLMREEGIPFNEIKEIRFEYTRIIRITHLWALKSLTKLQMNNNFIEKIHGIETLVNLTVLDFSFNNISKIENLDTLVNLRKLMLFENEIIQLENMDTLKNLRVFSIGNNLVTDRENVLYLRRFPNLISLNMVNNPCSDDEKEFEKYISAFLPNLIYYTYKEIRPEDRQLAIEHFERELNALHFKEEQSNAQRSAEEAMEREAELHSLAFVEYLNSRFLFDQLFENDPDGKAFLKMGEHIKEVYKEFETKFLDQCMYVFDIGQKSYEIRTQEIEQYTKAVENAKKNDQDLGIKDMEDFLEEKDNIFKEISEWKRKRRYFIVGASETKTQINDLVQIFDVIKHNTWKSLMKKEIQIHEQLEEVIHNLERNLTDMIHEMIEKVQAGFINIRAAEMSYTESLSDAANAYLTATVTSDSKPPKDLAKIMVDKETVANAIANTHDVHLQLIDRREDTLMFRAKKWLGDFIENLIQDEFERNRYKILEINLFLDLQMKELDKLIGTK